MSQLSEPVNLPSVMESKLQAVRRRSLTFRATEVMLVAGTVLLAGMLVAMAVDWMVVLFDPGWRTVLTMSALGVTVLLLVVYAVRTAMGRYGLSTAAREVDRAVPALQERWSTVTELAESTDPTEMRGAPTLIDKVSDEATGMSGLVNEQQVVTPDVVRSRAYALGAVLAVLLLAFLFAPRHTGVLVQRFWSPRSEISMTRVTALTGDRVVPKGEALTLEAQIEGRDPESATLFLVDGDGETAVSPVRKADAPALLSYQTRVVDDAFEYRFRAGDGQTAWHRITPAERPSLADIRFRITPPEYSGLPVDAQAALPRKCRALEGSRLEVAFGATKPLSRMELRFGPDDVSALEQAEDTQFRYATTLTKSLSFTAVATDEQGLTNSSPPSCRVTVYRDQPPVVEIVSPDERIAAPPDDTIPVDFKAADDFGVAAAELVVTVEDEGQSTERIVPIPLDDEQDAKVIQKRVELDLEQLGVKHGSQVTYAVRVADTRGMTALGKPGQQPADEAQKPSEEAVAQTDTPQQDPKQTESTPGQPDSPAAPTAQGRPEEQEPSSADSSSPPPNGMAKRVLDVPMQCTACSRQHRIIVDKWAGSFEDPERKKLQLAIDKYLKQLDAQLAAAQAATDAVRTALRADDRWNDETRVNLETGRDELTEADKTIAELKGKASGTPYAFISLQLDDIGLAHVTPARKHLGNVPAEDRFTVEESDALARAAYHIDQARERLAALTRQYEAVKREEKLAAAMERVAKMHQVFLNDLQNLLGSKKPGLNPRTGEMIEVSDEYAKLLQEKYDKLKELLDELSKILADDPELLRRFMALMRLEGTTIRDQLTLLAQRQRALHEQTSEWIGAAEAERPAVREKLLDGLLAEQQELAQVAAELHNNVVTWMPRSVDRRLPALARCRVASQATALAAGELADHCAARRRDEAFEQAATVVESIKSFRDALEEGRSVDDPDGKLALFIANRMTEAAKLRTRQLGWIKKVESMRADDYGRTAAVVQTGLQADTMDFGVKLDRVAAQLNGMSDEIGPKARELEELVSMEIAGSQMAAAKAHWDNQLPSAHEFEAGAVAAFDKAERLFDEILTMVEETIAAMPPPERPCPAPTLEALLAMLENEGKACEKLGAALRSNIALQGNWMWPGSGSGSGSGTGSSQGFGSQALARAQARAAELYAQEATEQMQKVREYAAALAAELAMRLETERQHGGQGAGGEGQSGAGAAVAGRDWNVLVSKLRDELKQGRDTTPPEQYRRAIEAYFRNINDLVPDAAPAP